MAVYLCIVSRLFLIRDVHSMRFARRVCPRDVCPSCIFYGFYDEISPALRRISRRDTSSDNIKKTEDMMKIMEHGTITSTKSIFHCLHNNVCLDVIDVIKIFLVLQKI